MLPPPVSKSDGQIESLAAPPAAGSRPTRVRHIVLALTVAAYMITYMDRQILAVGAAHHHEGSAHLAGDDGLGSRSASAWLTRCFKSPAVGWAINSAHAARSPPSSPGGACSPVSRPWPGARPPCS